MADEDADRFDPEILAAIRRLTAGVDELFRRHGTALRAPVVPGSLVAADRALPDGRFVTIYAGQALSAAIDHLNAWRLIINSPQVPSRAHFTILRGALEGSVRCRWHVDAKVDAGTRVGRGHAGRRDDQVERRKFDASKEPKPRPPLRPGGLTAVQRLAAFDDRKAVKLREAAGIRSVDYTDTTRLMITYGHERWFRLSSGLGHGKEWALVVADLKPSPEPPLAPGMQSGTFSASEPVALDLTAVAVGAIHAALADLEAYFAPPPDRP